MGDFDNYPPGAALDPRAPYNQSDPEEIEVDVYASFTIGKPSTITTDNYVATYWEDCEPDDEGGYVCSGGTDYDFSNCDFNTAFSEQHFNPIELLAILKKYAEADFKGENHSEGYKAKLILEACDGWNIDDSEVVVD